MSEQERIESEDSHASMHAGLGSGLISVSRRVLVSYPDEQVSFDAAVNGPRGRILELTVEGISEGVASIIINPERARAPFTGSVTVRVHSGAPPGNYTLSIEARDVGRGALEASENVSLIILREDVPRAVAEHYNQLKAVFSSYGSNGLIWYILKHVYPEGASFKQVKSIYEQVLGKNVGKGTVENILKRMIDKGIIVREDNRYKLLVTEYEVLKTRVDTTRVRTNSKPAAKKTKAVTEGPRVPDEVLMAYRRALKIKKKHGLLPAVCFLAHTLGGIRESGYLLLWLNEWFLYCERKTGFCHHFYSQLLHEYLRALGAKQGIIYRLTRDYSRAHRIARKYIRKYYKSYPLARRLHYILKKNKLVEYGSKDEIYVVEVLNYSDGTVGLKIWDNSRKELLYSENVRDEPAKKEVKTAYPYEHVYEPNEETYFHRPANLY